MGKVGGAVERVNVPAIIATSIDQTLFFAEDIWLGQRFVMRSRIRISELRSAMVTRSASPLYSTFTCC